VTALRHRPAEGAGQDKAVASAGGADRPRS
jgi:hypothetical protein